jgi:hypothetical protein
VIDDLISSHSLSEADLIVLAGESAGGLGLLLNSNRLKAKLEKEAPQAKLKSIVDSAWLLDMLPVFLQNQGVQPSQMSGFIRMFFDKTINYWNAQLPVECTGDLEHVWDCFAPDKFISSIKSKSNLCSFQIRIFLQIT